MTGADVEVELPVCANCGHPEFKHHPTRTETWCIHGIATGFGCCCSGYRPYYPA